MCTQEQYTYLYAQALLHRLAKEPHGHMMRRLSQELELAVQPQYFFPPSSSSSSPSYFSATTHSFFFVPFCSGKAAKGIDNFLIGVSGSTKVAEAVSTIIRNKATTPGDVLTLHDEYASPNAPPVDYLQNAVLLDILLHDLFATKIVNPLHKAKYFFVVACAVSFAPGTRGRLDQSVTQPIVATLKEAEIVVRANPFGFELQASILRIRGLTETPVVAKAMMYWIRNNLADKDYYANNFSKTQVPIHLILLEEIAVLHPLLREDVFAVFVVQLDQDHPGVNTLLIGELRKTILDRLLFLVQLGFVAPVLAYLRRKTGELDHSLITYFVHSLLDMIEPPYSGEFVGQLLPVISPPALTPALAAHPAIKPLILPFLEDGVESNAVTDKDKETAQTLLTSLEAAMSTD